MESACELGELILGARTIRDLRDTFSKSHHHAAAMEYYLSVTELLIELQKSGESRGRIAIMCPKPFANGDWVRTISQIMQCDNDRVKMRFI